LDVPRAATTSDAFNAIAEPRRRDILNYLSARERPVGDIVAALGLAQPSVSKHLRVLRQAGLVEARIDAQRRVYSLRPEPLAEVDSWLGDYRALWQSRLDALHTEIARGKRSST